MAWMMEVVSDSTATDLCTAAAGGVEAVNACMRELGLDGITMTGTALDWFRALAGSMDPALATVSPGERARIGYPLTRRAVRRKGPLPFRRRPALFDRDGTGFG